MDSIALLIAAGAGAVITLLIGFPILMSAHRTTRLRAHRQGWSDCYKWMAKFNTITPKP